jgi:hypothetical protein
MGHYDDELTLRDARGRYFARSGFDEGSYRERWVKLQAGPMPIYFPNTRARIRAVKLHDLHHVLTEYETTWTGEAEIGAWEIAAGCGRHHPAWLLNLNAMAIGLAIAPRATHRAFLRGRQTKSLYAGEFEEELLSRRVGPVRHELLLDRAQRPPTTVDRLAFATWAAAALVVAAAPLAALVAIAIAVHD